MTYFEMAVRDTSHLTGGLTAFVGPIQFDSAPTMILPCDCEIVLDGKVKALVRIDGVMIATRKKTLDRSISTSQPIDLRAIGVEKGGFIIRSKV
jgi:hypothetical protein